MIFRKTCRVCGAHLLKPVYNFGKLFISTFLKGPSVETHVPTKAPLSLYDCTECGLLQLRHTAPQQEMWVDKYWYESGLNKVIVEDLKEVVVDACSEVDLNVGDVWVDIGANDGTLLSNVSMGLHRLGVEPASNLIPKLRKHCESLIPDFWTAEKYESFGFRPAKVVTAIGMFYDMEDPGQFVGDVKKVLADDGVFIAQLMTSKQMIEQNDVGNVCHEHIEFYTYPSLVRLFEDNGLEIYRVEENTINGGSYRLFARHYKEGSVKHQEQKPDYEAWVRRIEKNRTDTLEYLERCHRDGKKVYGYGASTKFNTILQWYGLGPRLVRGIAEKHPDKVNTQTVGSGIPVIDEARARKEADVFWVGPYGFVDNFIKKERDLGFQGDFMVCTPKFRLYAQNPDILVPEDDTKLTDSLR